MLRKDIKKRKIDPNFKSKNPDYVYKLFTAFTDSLKDMEILIQTINRDLGSFYASLLFNDELFCKISNICDIFNNVEQIKMNYYEQNSETCTAEHFAHFVKEFNLLRKMNNTSLKVISLEYMDKYDQNSYHMGYKHIFNSYGWYLQGYKRGDCDVHGLRICRATHML